MFLRDWFSLTPPPLAGVYVRVGIAVALACALGAIILRAMVIRRIPHAFLRRPWMRVARLLTANGIVLLTVLFFQYEGVPFLSARFWFALLVLGDVVWVIAIARHVLTHLPKERAAWLAGEQKRKYLR